MKHLTWLLVTVVMTSNSLLATAAQAGRTATAPHTVTAFGFGPAGTMISTKRHAPFSATLVVHMEQTLSDGTRIEHDNEEMVKRDSLGRIYRARKIKRPGAKEPDPWVLVTITDPAHHIQYSCTPIRMCSKMEYRQPPAATRRLGRPDVGTRSNLSTEELGASNISGVVVEGKRVTWMIQEGAVGNDRPFSSGEEVWHSKDLDVDVQVKRVDPRVGTRTSTLTELILGEPDASYFQVPAGYRVQERRVGSTRPLSPLPEESGSSFPSGTLPPH